MIIIIGGGASGIFAACIAASLHPKTPVIVLEKTMKLLSKVRISGGGRCNVTHAAFDPKALVSNYPRGSKELLGPFQKFGPVEMISWLQERGVSLKTEEDGRMFPTTNSSETIAEALLREADKLGVIIKTGQKITHIEKKEDLFHLYEEDGSCLTCSKLLLATGSSPQGHAFAEHLGHTIIPPVPSLFTFNIPTSPLLDLSGITLEDALLTLPDAGKLKQRGPLLLTHFGLSGPAALKLSAFAARNLYAASYTTTLLVNFVPDETQSSVFEKLLLAKKNHPLKTLETVRLFNLPVNLYKRFLELSSIAKDTRLSHLANTSLRKLSQILTESSFQIAGKTTYKQEFVTAGGIDLKEIHFKTMESKRTAGLYFAGEILDIDGITGGFNFQNAWTTGWLAGHALAQ